MTDRTDVARGRDIVARWSALAEQRLHYLTELFETGRWRRYHSERDFLDNIREARCAVETWRGLLSAEAMPDNRPLELSWIGRSSSVPPPARDVPVGPILSVAPRLPEPPAAPAISVAPAMVDVNVAAEPEPEPALALDPPGPAEEGALGKTLALTLDIVGLAERYPLLRNAFQQTGNG